VANATEPAPVASAAERVSMPHMSATAIVCPSAASGGCHSLLRIDRASGAVVAVHPMQYPIKAVRVGANAVYIVDGISFARITVSTPESVPSQGSMLQLETSLGDFRDAALCETGLTFLTNRGLHILATSERAARTVALLPDAWHLACHESAAVLSTGVSGMEMGTIQRADLANGKRQQLAREPQPGAVALDAQGAYWTTSGPEPYASIRMLAAGGSSVVTLASHERGARVLATDGDRVYWLCDAPDGRHLRSVAKAGGAVRELLHLPAPEGTRSEEQLTIRGDEAYFLAAGKLERVRTDGTQPTVVAQTGPGGRVSAFDVFGNAVYAVAEFPPTRPFANERPELGG
jgi:hypothetical protein